MAVDIKIATVKSFRVFTAAVGGRFIRYSAWDFGRIPCKKKTAGKMEKMRRFPGVFKNCLKGPLFGLKLPPMRRCAVTEGI